ncbi:MAG: DUF1579 family protein [Phycisphaerales bacterium]
MRTCISVASALSPFVVVVLTLQGPGCTGTRPADQVSSPQPCTDPYLQHLLGSWHIERAIRGEIVTNSMDVVPILDGKFVRIHMQSTTQGQPYEAVVLVGHNDPTDEYVAYWCDSFGAEYSAEGRGKRVDNTLEFTFRYPNGPFFNTWTFDPEHDRWTFVGESGASDGTRRLFARDGVTRAPKRQDR